MSNKDLQPFASMLQPLLRLMLENGVSYQELAALLKHEYVGVAADHFGKNGRPTNVSRISLLTGLDRKEVKRQLDQRTESGGRPPASRTDRITRVLMGWHTDDRFSDGAGNARTLSSADSGEFWDLLSAYAGDVPHTAFLKELVRLQAVSVDGEQVTARTRTFIPPNTDPMAVARATEVVHDLGDTLIHNLYPANGDDTPRFERRVMVQCASGEVADRFNSLLADEGQAFLEKLDAWLEQQISTTRDTNDGEGSYRLGLGMYLIQDQGDDQ